MYKFIFFLFCSFSITYAQKINRREVVERHKVHVTSFDTLASLSIGNGGFAMTVDATGLQTFPEYYQNGVPLGTQSDWGWHSFPNLQNYKIEESLRDVKSHGRTVPYTVQISQNGRSKDAANFLRQNPHRLQLGNLGFELTKKDGSLAQMSDIQNIDQTLNPYTGIIESHFVFEGEKVDLETSCNQDFDAIYLKINSKLLANGQLKLKIRFPYPTDKFTDYGTNYENEDKHISKIYGQNVLSHRLDSTQYFVTFETKDNLLIHEKLLHCFTISPKTKNENWEVNVEFGKRLRPLPMKKTVLKFKKFEDFWQTGGAVDFSGSTDPRAFEVERRVVLSQYLTKIQCTSNTPPQETGLTYNSWYGKPHMEMHWWHGVHFAQWGRPELLERSLGWYNVALPTAKKLAKRQGFEGARWQKMTDPFGGETSSSVGAYLIWQQPHIITFAELLYQQKPSKEILEKYKNLIFETADFMASYAYFDKAKNRYILGTGLIPAQECFKADTTFNPTYELNYWHWALTTAQTWRKRLGLSQNAKYQDVIDKLSPLPVKDGVYLATESTPESYTNPAFTIDHPAVVGAYGMLPLTSKMNPEIMQRTYDKIIDIWHWDHTWGWDFPLMAMTAARLNQPEKAVSALLMNVRTNTYLSNGHNYQDGRLRIYLPGNGGVLSAVALMCTQTAFPKNGWKVRWEGLKPLF